jgi:hypothetical protein
MTPEQRERLKAIRSRKHPDAATAFLLALVTELDDKLGRAVASASTYKELFDAYEKASNREEAALKAQIAQGEAQIAELEAALKAVSGSA